MTTIATLHAELAEKTRVMREAQQRYYRSRTRDDLMWAKKIEREVDDLLRAIETESLKHTTAGM